MRSLFACAIGIALSFTACGRRNFNVDAGDGDDGAGRANYAFVTSSRHSGNLGGLVTADQICNERAISADVEGTYVALLSSGGVDAIGRIAGSRGWQRIDGAPIADHPGQIAGLNQWNPIYIDELGQDVRSSATDNVWTGSTADGLSSGEDCNGWTNTGATADRGTSDSGGGSMLEIVSDVCTELNRIYCFELGGTRPLSPPAPTAGRLIFVSTAAWLPNASGVNSADQQCQVEATTAGRAGTFRAALAPDGITVASRFSLSGGPWVRADGVVVAEGPELFGFARSHVGMTATGAKVPHHTEYWAGDPNSDVSGCGNWLDNNSGVVIPFGSADATAYGNRFDDGLANCATSYLRLLCIES